MNLVARSDAQRARATRWVVGLLVALLPGLTGCRVIEGTMLGLSRLKSPLTVAMPPLNQPLGREELALAGINEATLLPTAPRLPSPPAERGARADDFADLARKPVVVAVCLSGGGARAARLAAHTLAQLEEQYNQTLGAEAAARPLQDQIDVWSTVSGGSVFASYVSSALAQTGERHKAFARLRSTPRVRWSTQRLGAMAAMFYFWPGNLGYAPVMQVLTEWDTLELFARTLAMFQEGRLPILPASTLRTLGDLPPRPRFFFNATCLETGSPVVFTQSILHRNLEGDPLTRLAADPLVRWAEGDTNEPPGLSEPLRHAVTLEDLGSSPARFPVCYAALGSAAFPGIFQPLLLPKYQQPTNPPPANGPGRAFPWRRTGLVTIVDGGIHDNTGLLSVLELARFLQTRGEGTNPVRLVILSVNASNEPDTYTGPTKARRVPWRFDLPIRGLAPAVSSMLKLHTKEQSLVRAALQRRLHLLAKAGIVQAFEVSLLDAKHDAEAIRKIPTDFVLTDREDNLLRDAVAERLNRPRPGSDGAERGLAAAFIAALRATR